MLVCEIEPLREVDGLEDDVVLRVRLFEPPVDRSAKLVDRLSHRLADAGAKTDRGDPYRSRVHHAGTRAFVGVGATECGIESIAVV